MSNVQVDKGNYTHQGTQLVQTSTGRGTTARIRKIYVRRLNSRLDGPSLIAAAKNAYLENEPGFAPGLRSVPLQRITGRQITANLVEIIAEYSGNNDIVGSGTQILKFATSIMPTKIWSASDTNEASAFVKGMPFQRLLGGGEINTSYTQEEKDAALSTVHNRKVVVIKLQRSQFGVNPLVSWGSYINTTGGGNLAGLSCANGTLLLKGLTSNATTPGTLDPIGQTPAANLVYDYNLEFVYDPEGFPIQYWERSEDSGIVGGGSGAGENPPPRRARRGGALTGYSSGMPQAAVLGDPEPPEGGEEEEEPKYTYTLRIGSEFKNGGWSI